MTTPTPPPDANAYLMGGGAKALAFKTIGTTHTGRITKEPELRQQTDPKDKSPKFFPSGDPMWVCVVEVATNLRDTPDDDGTRSFWIGGAAMAVVREAVRVAGADGLKVGGALTMTFVSEKESTAAGVSPTKIYTASYVPPPNAANAALMSSGNGAQPATAATTATVAAAVPAAVDPVAAAIAAAQAAQAAAAQPALTPPPGVTDDVWATLSVEQRRAVLANVAAG